MSAASWTFQPVTPERWADFEQLFGPHGASAGCWCMFERLTRAEFAREQGAGNKQTMRAIIAGGAVPGLLAYAGTAPVGWCSIGPRKVYGALERSRRLQRVDDQPVWSVVCFFTARSARRQGLTVALLRAAVAYAREHGARIVEGARHARRVRLARHGLGVPPGGLRRGAAALPDASHYALRAG